MGLNINSPLPSSLASECRKSAKILNSFIDAGSGLDVIIPPGILADAKGLAIFTVLKAGFLFSGRAGSGLVVARLPDGTWSAPSAIMTGGMGFGGQVGAELTDFVMVLNTTAAVKTFMSHGSITLGGNISVAAGPVGRNAEASGTASIKNVSAVYSYSKTRGLFAGVSLEGSVIVERFDANAKMYGGKVKARDLLNGTIPPPPSADPLYRALEMRFQQNRPGGRFGHGDHYTSSGDRFDRFDSYDRGGYNNNNTSDYHSGDYRSDDRYNDDRHQSDSYNNNSQPMSFSRGNVHSMAKTGSGGGTDYYGNGGRPRGNSLGNWRNDSPLDYEPPRHITSAAPNTRSESSRAVVVSNNSTNTSLSRDMQKARALFNFKGEQDGDLPFNKGDVICIVKKTNTTNDWWTGVLNGKQGIFPANFVELI